MFSSGSGYTSIKKELILFLFGGLLYAQEQKGGSSFPKIDTPKPNYGLLILEEKVEDYSFLERSKSNNNSMMDSEDFIDPGDRYLKKLKKDRPIPNNVYLGDTYLGDIRTNASYARIVCRDYEYEDGDRVRISVNEQEVISNLLLKNQFFILKLPLVQGFNKIDFQALNQGSSGPNTAELRVFDDNGAALAAHKWNLSTGSTATMIIVKDGEDIIPQ
jgi:hypothetical protein